MFESSADLVRATAPSRPANTELFAMTDDSYVLQEALHSAFPECEHFLCSVHLVDALLLKCKRQHMRRRTIEDLGNKFTTLVYRDCGHSEQKHIEWEMVAMTQNHDKACTNYAEMWANGCDPKEIINEKGIPLTSWFIEKFLARTKKWVYREKRLISEKYFGQGVHLPRSNNISESSFARTVNNWAKDNFQYILPNVTNFVKRLSKIEVTQYIRRKRRERSEEEKRMRNRVRRRAREPERGPLQAPAENEDSRVEEMSEEVSYLELPETSGQSVSGGISSSSTPRNQVQSEDIPEDEKLNELVDVQSEDIHEDENLNELVDVQPSDIQPSVESLETLRDGTPIALSVVVHLLWILDWQRRYYRRPCLIVDTHTLNKLQNVGCGDACVNELSQYSHAVAVAFVRQHYIAFEFSRRERKVYIYDSGNPIESGVSASSCSLARRLPEIWEHTDQTQETD